MASTSSQVKLGPLGEVHVSVKDLEVMREFYVSVIGFEEEFYHPGEMLGLITGGSSLAFVSGDSSASGVALAIECDDVDATVAQLEVMGIEITERPWDGHWGGRVAAFQDPEGNTVYLEQSDSGQQQALAERED